MNKLVLLALLLPALCHAQGPALSEAAPTSVSVSADRLNRIDRVLQEYVDQGKQAGIIALVARNGKIVYHKAFGMDNPAIKTPLKRDAIFRIASQTKAITTVAAMMLFEEGRILLDEPDSKYIPAFKNPTVLDKFKGREAYMFERLELKYVRDPVPDDYLSPEVVEKSSVAAEEEEVVQPTRTTESDFSGPSTIRIA